jgi:glycosyltransferase involved in cell wall biosynthesis
MIRVLFISYLFPPVGGSGVQRAQKFVQYLPEEGFLPVVVAGPALREDRWAPIDPTMLAKVPANIPVHRVADSAPPPPSRMRGRLERWLGLQSAFEQWWVRSATELACGVSDGTQLIFATMAPYESAEVASEASRRLGIPWVADLRDPWALDDIQIYPTRFHRKLEMAKMDRLLSTAAAIIMNTPAAADALKEAFPGLRHKKILSITNGFNWEDFSESVTSRTDGKFRIVHSGGMFTGSGLQLRRRNFYRLLGGVEPGVNILTRSPEYLLKAIDQWIMQRPEVGKDLEIIFAGSMTAEDRALVNSSKAAAFVQFPGFLSHEKSLQLIRTADLLFLPMHNLPPGQRCRSIPGKAFEYIASGRPILAAVPDGDARDFLRQCGTGLLCRPDDIQGMIEILDRIYSAWKEGRVPVSPNADYASRFEGHALTRDLADIFRATLEKPEISGETHVMLAEPTSLPGRH